MRPIKFRAWDAARKEMFPASVNDDLLVKFFREVNERGAHATVMQYTGLKDKNGKEIYEGDIVSAKYLNTPKEVIYSRGMFTITMIHFVPESCEVIGNIYENPELEND